MSHSFGVGRHQVIARSSKCTQSARRAKSLEFQDAFVGFGADKVFERAVDNCLLGPQAGELSRAGIKQSLRSGLVRAMSSAYTNLLNLCI